MSDSGPDPALAEFPQHIVEVFEAIKEAMQIQGTLGCVRLTADGGSRTHFCLGIIDPRDGGIWPVAIIPTEKRFSEFLNRYDLLLDKLGPESDPDFKKHGGILQ